MPLSTARAVAVWIAMAMFLVSQDLSGTAPARADGLDLAVVLEVPLGQGVQQLRAVPVRLGKGAPRAILAVFCQDAEVDPYVEMFFFPKDTLKLVLFSQRGKVLWRRDLGPGVVPGIWFCPVLPFDLDGDGAEEIWFVNNIDADHPLSLRGRRLERIDAATGKTTGRWPWPRGEADQSPSHLFRNFLLGGHAKGRPVLVTAQGTYGPMRLQGWNADLSRRWEHKIARRTPGARGSHMCPVVDVNGDGVDEVFWGERCIELDTGKELFCGDRATYRGHSDVVQPVLDRRTKRWVLYTCRESAQTVSPRVALFDDTGRRVWGDLDRGHMDMGWVARLGPEGEPVALAIRIDGKSAGPDGFARTGVEEFTYDALTGRKHPTAGRLFATMPVDLNGDGIHELVRALTGGDGKVLDRTGQVVGQIRGTAAMGSKFLDRPGEQVLTYDADGVVRVWADRNAADSPAAGRRYRHPFYQANQRLTACGYNLVNLGGL